MSDSAIDQDVFAELKEATGADFVADLVMTFLDEAPGMIAELRAAQGAGDADRIRRAAHSIKSNANVFGASALAEVARGVELNGLGCDAGAVLDALDREFATAAAALKAMLDG